MYDSFQHYMEHLHRVKPKSKRYFRSQSATKYEHYMEHLHRVKPKSKRYFRSQSATKYGHYMEHLYRVKPKSKRYFRLQSATKYGHDMEHLPRVKPKSERSFRSQSATEYGICLLLLLLIDLLRFSLIDLLGFGQFCFHLFFLICFLLFFLICFQHFGQNDMEHLSWVKPKSERYFRSQSTKYVYVEIGLLLLVLLEKTLKKLEKLIWQLEEEEKQSKTSTNELKENQERSKTSTTEDKQNQEGTHRLVQPHQGPIAPESKPRPQLTTSWYAYLAVLIMALFVLCCGATWNTDCLTTQSVLLGSQGIIRCRPFENSTRFFWYDMNIEGGDSALIILENGQVSGTGYTTGEFNIDSDGSLIINSVTVQHERVFRLESVSPSLIRSTDDITVIAYVEPIEPIPVITECLGKSDCIMKGNLDGVISCVHHNTRPAATISWFMRDGTRDIPLNSTTSQKLSADLITFSVTSEMAIGETPLLASMQSLVLLVCKSYNPYSVVQESNSKVLLDLSQNDPFKKQLDLPGDPVYAIQNQDLVLECPQTIAAEDSIVMWMFKSPATKNIDYLIYSAYSVVPAIENDEQFSLDKNGDLVISQVGVQHDGLYACVKSTGNTTKSYLQLVEVIVQPTPSTVLVEGCILFQPCSFYITETKTITCEVNGVHPKVELMIKALSTNLAVIKTEVSTYEDEGLFYTSIHGDVIVVDASCQENGTIICQAVGPAANIFKSNVYITILSHGEKCPQTSAAPFPPDKEVQTSPAIKRLTIAIALLSVCIVIIFIWLCVGQRKHLNHMQAVRVTELNSM